MHLLHRHGLIPPDTLRKIADEVGVGLSRAARVGFWLSLMCFGFLVLSLAIHLYVLVFGSMSLGDVVKRVGPLAGGWIAPFIIWVGVRKARHQRITKVMLHNLRCCHCGYDLRSLPQDHFDGTTTCP